MKKRISKVFIVLLIIVSGFMEISWRLFHMMICCKRTVYSMVMLRSCLVVQKFDDALGHLFPFPGEGLVSGEIHRFGKNHGAVFVEPQGAEGQMLPGGVEIAVLQPEKAGVNRRDGVLGVAVILIGGDDDGLTPLQQLRALFQRLSDVLPSPVDGNRADTPDKGHRRGGGESGFYRNPPGFFPSPFGKGIAAVLFVTVLPIEKRKEHSWNQKARMAWVFAICLSCQCALCVVEMTGFFGKIISTPE